MELASFYWRRSAEAAVACDGVPVERLHTRITTQPPSRDSEDKQPEISTTTCSASAGSAVVIRGGDGRDARTVHDARNRISVGYNAGVWVDLRGY